MLLRMKKPAPSRQNGRTVLLALAIMLANASPEMAQAEKPIWVGESGGFSIRWTPEDITAFPSNNPSNILFSAKRNADKDFAVFKKENLTQEAGMKCSYEQTFRLLSVVGSIVSYRVDEYSYCGSGEGGPGWAHPSTNISYHVIDLNYPTRQIKLWLYYSEGEILKALMADPLVKKAMPDNKSKNRPKTIDALVETFAHEGLSLQPLAATPESPEGCAYTFPDEILTQFAFHHLENNKVAVRLRLEPDSGACRAGHAQLGLLLAIPESLKKSLEAAEAQKEGFMMKDAKSLSGNRNTVFKYEARPSDRKRNP